MKLRQMFDRPEHAHATTGGAESAYLHELSTTTSTTPPDGDVEAILAAVSNLLYPKYGHLDPQILGDAIDRSFLQFYHKQSSLGPNRDEPFISFLAHRASRIIHNNTRAEIRRQRRQAIFIDGLERFSVELSPPAEDYYMECIDLFTRAIQVLPDPADQQVLRLWMEGNRRTADFAPIMGLAHMPFAAQCLKVKRAKDRIFKRLRRKFGRQRFPGMARKKPKRQSHATSTNPPAR